MAWDGELATLPMRTLLAGTTLHHGTDCAGEFDAPDGPAWFSADAEGAAYWAGWNVPVDGREDGERRTHAFETIHDIRVIDLDAMAYTDEDWVRLCLAATGIDDELTRNELAEALVGHGFAGWIGDEEVMLTDPAPALRFLGRTHVPGPNLMRPVPTTFTPRAPAP